MTSTTQQETTNYRPQTTYNPVTSTTQQETTNYRPQTTYNSMTAAQQQQMNSAGRNQRINITRRSNDTYPEKEMRKRSPSIRRRSPLRRSPTRRNSPFRNRSPMTRRSPPPGRRSRSPVRRSDRRDSRSPDRNRSRRTVTRYACNLPRCQLDTKDMSVMDLRRRYNNMYIPSDFFNVRLCWTEVLPLHRPLRLGAQTCSFHVRRRNVSGLPVFHGNSETTSTPTDASHLFSAKVMLLSTPVLREIYNSTCDILPSPGRELSHPTRILEFLVGLKGKEPMIIGGPWSESEDGPNPESNPSVLVNTAIRTTKQMTGLDLSSCTKWYRFLELKYNRDAETSKSGRVLSARVETVVVLLPDVSSCVPDASQWQHSVADYMRTEGAAPGSVEAEDAAAAAEDAAAAEVKQPVDGENNVGPSPSSTSSPTYQLQSSQDILKMHHSDINIKNLKVHELREQLEVRGLNSKGLKAILSARLQKTLRNEDENQQKTEAATQALQHAEKEMLVNGTCFSTTAISEEKIIILDDDSNAIENEKKGDVNEQHDKMYEEPIVVKDDEVNKDSETKKEEPNKEDKKNENKSESSEIELKEDFRLTYPLPNTPCLVVQPNNIIRNGTFDCKVFSLSILLDYRQEDKKEHSFELSLFAELFNEMLMRDFGFTIYRSLLSEIKVSELKKAKEEAEKKIAEEETKKIEEFKKAKLEVQEQAKKDNEEAKRNDEDTKTSEDVDCKADGPKEDGDNNHASKAFTDIELTVDDDEDMFAEEEKKLSYKKSGGDCNGSTDKTTENDKSKTTCKRTHEDGNNVDIEVKKPKIEDPKNKEKVGRSRDKLSTVHTEVLLAYTYFDQSRTRYLMRSDLEDILHIIGLKLSRSQIKKLCENVGFSSGRENAVHYHKITDITDSRAKIFHELDNEDIEHLSKGNRISCSPSGSTTSATSASAPVVTQTGVVEYKGALINVDNILSQLDAGVETKLTAERKLSEALLKKDAIEECFANMQSLYQNTSKKLAEATERLKSESDEKKNSVKHSLVQRDLLIKVKRVLDNLTDDVGKSLEKEVSGTTSDTTNGEINI